jgi:hypothetical protein
MSVLGKFFGKSGRREKSIQESVADEVRFLIASAAQTRGVVNAQRIIAEVERDPMDWYLIRDRRYGESGSHSSGGLRIRQPCPMGTA